MSAGEWMNKMWHILIKEYYSSIKKEQTMIHTTRIYPQNLSYVEEARYKNYTVSDSISMKGLEKQKTDSM